MNNANAKSRIFKMRSEGVANITYIKEGNEKSVTHVTVHFSTAKSRLGEARSHTLGYLLSNYTPLCPPFINRS